MSQESVEGYNAYLKGIPFMECPYPFSFDDTKRDDWCAGFQHAQAINIDKTAYKKKDEGYRYLVALKNRITPLSEQDSFFKSDDEALNFFKMWYGNTIDFVIRVTGSQRKVCYESSC